MRRVRAFQHTGTKRYLCTVGKDGYVETTKHPQYARVWDVDVNSDNSNFRRYRAKHGDMLAEAGYMVVEETI